MDQVIEKKLNQILNAILEVGIDISFFAIIRTGDADRWDLVIGGKNIENQKDFLAILKIVKNMLDRNEIVFISRLALVNSDRPFIKNINQAFNIGGGAMITIRDSRINDIFIKEAKIFSVIKPKNQTTSKGSTLTKEEGTEGAKSSS